MRSPVNANSSPLQLVYHEKGRRDGISQEGRGLLNNNARSDTGCDVKFGAAHSRLFPSLTDDRWILATERYITAH